MNPHQHALVADGVFRIQRDGSAESIGVLSPTDDDIVAVCKAVQRKVLRLIEHRIESGDIDDDALSAAERDLAYAPLGPRRR